MSVDGNEMVQTILFDVLQSLLVYGCLVIVYRGKTQLNSTKMKNLKVNFKKMFYILGE